jgi:hypothetical protein
MKRQNLVLKKKAQSSQPSRYVAWKTACAGLNGVGGHAAPHCPTHRRRAKIRLAGPSTRRAPDTTHHDIRPRRTGETAGIQTLLNLEATHSSILRRRTGTKGKATRRWNSLMKIKKQWNDILLSWKRGMEALDPIGWMCKTKLFTK